MTCWFPVFGSIKLTDEDAMRASLAKKSSRTLVLTLTGIFNVLTETMYSYMLSTEPLSRLFVAKHANIKIRLFSLADNGGAIVDSLPGQPIAYDRQSLGIDRWRIDLGPQRYVACWH